MFKFFALNLFVALFLSACSHSNHSAHHHHHDKDKTKPCKVGQACDESKKTESCCENKAEGKEAKKPCCKES